MTRSEKIRLGILAVIGLAAVVFLLSRVIVFDHSARRSGDGFTWRGVKYVYTGGIYSGGRAVAKTDDGFTILSVKGDRDGNFYVLSSFLDSELCVREGYKLPTDGEIRGVSVNHHRLANRALTDVIRRAVVNFTVDGIHEGDGVRFGTAQCMRELSFFFDDNPVSADPYGFDLGTVDGEWVLARKISSRTEADDVYRTYEIYRFPADDAAMLEEYFS